MINIGVLCPSEIAFRRFMPALSKIKDAKFVGISHASEMEWFGKIGGNNLSILEEDLNKAINFVNIYGGKVFDSFEDLINSSEVDAIYIPLPPALHFKWAQKALNAGKHVLVEKPSTPNLINTVNLIDTAKNFSLAIHENYMFNFHSQLDYIEEVIKSGKIGNIRLFRIAFGFPFRGNSDFRYNKKLGGGALLDCGGYTIKLATRLLGKDVRLLSPILNYVDDFDVDIYGSATMVNSNKQVAQITFGMDNSYKCDLEVWGSKGTLFTGRVLTAPEGYEPTIVIKTNIEEKITLQSDDTFMKSIEHFIKCINNEETRKENYENIILQARLVDEFKGV